MKHVVWDMSSGKTRSRDQSLSRWSLKWVCDLTSRRRRDVCGHEVYGRGSYVTRVTTESMVTVKVSLDRTLSPGPRFQKDVHGCTSVVDSVVSLDLE